MHKKDRMKVCLNVVFHGIEGFDKYRPNVEIILCSLDKSSLIKFRLAINEAICNALRYGEGGIEKAKVRLTIRYNESIILAKISSNSSGFNVHDHLLNLNNVDQKNWWDSLKSKNRGRGFWIMLSGSQKVIFNKAGNEVILAMQLAGRHETEVDLLSKVHVLTK